MRSTYSCRRCKEKNFLIECSCGCEGIRTAVDKKGRRRHSINGHAGISLETHKFGLRPGFGFQKANTFYLLSPRNKYSCKRCKDTNLLIECACGCGGVRTERTKRNHHPQRYINGHGGIPFAKGNKLGIKFWNGNTIGLEHGFKNGHKPYGAAGKRGVENHAWKGGKTIRDGGYIMIRKPDHPFASNNYVLHHRLVIEEEWNCCLLPWASVHHRDENKMNNVWYNLWPMTNWQHTFLHNMKKYAKRDRLGGISPTRESLTTLSKC